MRLGHYPRRLSFVVLQRLVLSPLPTVPYALVCSPPYYTSSEYGSTLPSKIACNQLCFSTVQVWAAKKGAVRQRQRQQEDGNPSRGRK